MTLEEWLNHINIQYACRALLGDGKGKSVMEALRKMHPAYHEQVMRQARRELYSQGETHGQVSKMSEEH